MRPNEQSVNIYEESRRIKEADQEKLSFTSGQNSIYIGDKSSKYIPYKALTGRRPSEMKNSNHVIFGGRDNQHMVQSTTIEKNSMYMNGSGTFNQNQVSSRR